MNMNVLVGIIANGLYIDIGLINHHIFYLYAVMVKQLPQWYCCCGDRELAEK